MFEAFDIDILLDREWIQVDLLIHSSNCLELTGLLDAEHVLDVLLLLVQDLSSKAMNVTFSVFESVFNNTEVFLVLVAVNVLLLFVALTSFKHLAFFVHELH